MMKLEILSLIKKEAWHMFLGIYANKLVFNALKLCVKKNIKIALMFEPFNPQGWKGSLRLVLNYWYYKRIHHKIRFILPTGNLACDQYERVGYKADKIFQWGYFTEVLERKPVLSTHDTSQSALPSLLYIGQLIPRKNILSLIDVLIKHIDLFHSFKIICSGIQENLIKHKILNYPKIKLLGTLPNEKVKDVLSTVDLLVLPSNFDGWGAVVNEALLAGTPVLASENCGSSILLKSVRGEMFSLYNGNDLEYKLLARLHKGKITDNVRNEIFDWSRENITGSSASNYFTKIINYVEGKSIHKPIAPWTDN
jgi:glycosyltransferase involved in cell wall biosynthesis